MSSFVPPGSLLLSVPQMMDPNFMHTVVLVVEHSSDGAYGLVINRPLEICVSDLFVDHEVLSRSDFAVHQGGPVSADTLQFVHRMPDLIDGGLSFADDCFLGGSADQMMTALASDRAQAALRLFLGYSGWGAGQLEEELSVGSWVIAPADAQLLFGDGSFESMWRAALRSLGEGGEQLSRLPPDVSWN